jgi:hypothetical protein
MAKKTKEFTVKWEIQVSAVDKKNAASNFLSEQPEGSLFGAYLILVEELEKGNGKDLAANHVTVWEKLQNTMTVEDMVEAIQTAVTTEVPEFIEKTNWELLRGQKTVLLKLVNEIEKQKTSTAIISMPKETAEVLDGIINFLDSIQDYAVDIAGKDEVDVFGINPE